MYQSSANICCINTYINTSTASLQRLKDNSAQGLVKSEREETHLTIEENQKGKDQVKEMRNYTDDISLSVRKKTLCDYKQFSNLNELVHIYYILCTGHQMSGWMRCKDDTDINAADST